MDHVPAGQLYKHQFLIGLGHQYNDIDETSHPDMAERISAKEALIEKMANIIEHRVPLLLAFVAPGNGLKAGFLRAIGEKADPGILLNAVEKIANETGPDFSDLNLKWQVLRAYRNLYIRNPNAKANLVSSVNDVLPALLTGADKALTAGVDDLKKKLGMV